MWLARSPLLHPFLSPLLPPSWLAKYEITNKQIKQKLTTQPQIKHAPDNSLHSAPRPALPRSARPCRHRWLRRSLSHLRPPGTAPGPQPPFEGAARGPDTGRVHVLNPKAPASASVAPFRGRLLTSWFLCKGRGCWCALGEKTSKLERNAPESLVWGRFLRSRTPSARLRCARARVRQNWHQGGGRLSVRAQG